MQENTGSSSSSTATGDSVNNAASGFVGYERDIKDHSNLEELATFVGDGYDKSYRKRFSRLNDSKGVYVADWHWMAFLLPLPWLLYRKMFMYAVLYFIVLLPLGFFTSYAPYAAAAIHVLFGLFGGYLYYHHALQGVAAATGTASDREKSIKSKGGHLGLVSVIGICVALTGISAALVYGVNQLQYLDQVVSGGNKVVINKRVSAKMLEASQGIEQAVNSKWKKDGKSRLPAAVADLQQEYNLPKELFLDEWGTDIEYWPTRKGYSLRSAGPDTEFATDDDLFVESELK